MSRFCVDSILPQAKEIAEEKDAVKAAEMVQSKVWTIVNACINGDEEHGYEVTWILIRT